MNLSHGKMLFAGKESQVVPSHSELSEHCQDMNMSVLEL